MMPGDINTPSTNKPSSAAATGKGDNQNSGGRKTAARPAATAEHQAVAALKCPRCDSPNTKFCYYNNYSLTQPRHFCKTCRRYWTKGGALRNVPVGGGCRKNKKAVKSASARLTCGDSKDSSSSATSSSSFDQYNHFGGGLKFFHGISPAMDFQLGGLSFPRLLHHQHHHNPLSSFGAGGDVVSGITGTVGSSANSSANNISSSFNIGLDTPIPGNTTSNSLMGSFNYPLSLATGAGDGGGGGFSSGAIQNNMMSSGPGAGGGVHHNSLASSIESLSSINQDLHWKLQQQRLATMLFGGDQMKDGVVSPSVNNNNIPLASQAPKSHHHNQTVPILFQNLEISKPVAAAEVVCGSSGSVHQARKELVSSGGGDHLTAAATTTAAMEWFFGNSYAAAPLVTTPTPTNTSSSNGNDNGNGWNNGVQAWSDLQQFSALP